MGFCVLYCDTRAKKKLNELMSVHATNKLIFNRYLRPLENDIL